MDIGCANRAASNKISISQLPRYLPGDRIVVGLLIGNTSVSQDEWMNPLAQALRQKGFFTVGVLVGEEAGHCNLDYADAVIAARPEDLARLDRINIFILSDIDLCFDFPASSKVLGCVHAFDTLCSTPFHNQMHHISYLDGLMIPFALTPQTRELTTRLWTGFASREACKRKSGMFTFMPVPYPRLTALVQELAKQNIAPDSIAYAPMLASWVKECGGERMRKYGKSIIRALLNSFPQLNVIFRPYKSDINSDAVKAICASFAGEPRFIFDDSQSRFFTFSRSAVLVTDLSHIGASFSSAALRPAIYYQPWAGKKDSVINQGGNYTAYSMRDLIKCIRACLAEPAAHSARLLEFRNAAALPLENGFARIADNLMDFYADRPHADWLAIKRFDAPQPAADADVIKNILAYPESVALAASAAAIWRRPQSPLLLAFALHAGKKILPETAPLYAVDKAALKLLGSAASPATYGDIEPGIVELLYAKALRECATRKDVDGMSLARRLLEEFQEDFTPTQK